MIKQRNNLLILILTVGVFGILNTEMGIVGIIPQVSQHFDIAVPTAALLVSGFALVVAFAGPTMPLFFSGLNRKTAMLLALGVFTVCNAASLFAPNFETLLALRVIPAAFHPLYVSMAYALASNSGDAKASARASAFVFVGVSAGMVVGAPVANLLASIVSLEVSMAFFAAVTAAVFVLTVFLVPSLPVTEKLTYGSQLAILKKPLLWASCLSCAALNGAMFGFYGFLSDFLGKVSGMDAASISIVLLLYGLTNIVGNLIAGHTLASRATQTVMGIPFALMVAFGALLLFGQLTVGAAVVVAGLGVFVGIGNNVTQYLVSSAAPEAPDFANGMFLTTANLGVTVGSALCGMFISTSGPQYGIVGALIMLVAAVAFIGIRQALVRKTQQSTAPNAVGASAL